MTIQEGDHRALTSPPFRRSTTREDYQGRYGQVSGLSSRFQTHLANQCQQKERIGQSTSAKILLAPWLSFNASSLHNNNQALLDLWHPDVGHNKEIKPWGSPEGTEWSALKCIAQAPWFVSNKTLHRDLHMDTFEETIRTAAEKYSR